MTLADSAQVIVKLLNQVAMHFGYQKQSFDFVIPCVGNTHENMLRHVTGENDQEKLQVMGNYYREIIQEEMPRATTFFPNVDTCLSLLHEKNIKIGCLSIKPTNLLLASLNKFNLSKFFSAVKGREDVPAQKPDPRALLFIIDELAVQKNKVLYVGDSLVDENTAKRAQVDFIAMLLGATKKKQFDANYTSGYFTNWKDFTGYIINKVD